MARPAKLTKCRSCDAPVIWAVTRKQKWILIDATSYDHNQPWTDHATGKAPLFVHHKNVAHFATCPEADNWRRPRSKESQGADNP